jgi:DNA replication licensing factor MCM3
VTPSICVPAAEKALSIYIQNSADLSPAQFNSIADAQYHVGFDGSFGELHTNPRHLKAKLLSKLVAIDGIVTSCADHSDLQVDSRLF